MTPEELNEGLLPLLKLSDRQFDDGAKKILREEVLSIEDPTEKAKGLLWALDCCCCFSLCSDFEVMVLATFLEVFCAGNDIDEKALRDSPDRRNPLKDITK